jgi:hypothetical protein
MQNPLQPALIENDNMVEAIPAIEPISLST